MKLSICVKPEGTTIEISGNENEIKRTYAAKTPSGIEKICSECGKTFYTHKNIRLTCSAACKKERAKKYQKKRYRLEKKSITAEVNKILPGLQSAPQII